MVTNLKMVQKGSSTCPKSSLHYSAFLVNDNQHITTIVLTLNRPGRGDKKHTQLSAEQKMLLLRMRERRNGGLSCPPQGWSPQVTEICNIHLPHQAF